jgi:hypothetical protein
MSEEQAAPPPSRSGHTPIDEEDPFEVVVEEEVVAPTPMRPNVARSVSSVPDKLRGWYSQASFKQMTFAFLSIVTLGLDASFMYSGLVSSEAGLGLIGTLLAMNLPSPYDSKLLKKKTVDQVSTAS